MDINSSRNYGIDLLRIVSTFMIIVLHILGQGGVLKNLDMLSTKYIIAWFIEIMCYSAVNIYALISGYVGISSKHKYSNICNLWVQVVFYSLIIYGYFYFSRHKHEIETTNIFMNIFLPVMTQQYWYFTAYFALFFIMPCWNFLLKNMPQKQILQSLLPLLFLFSFLSVILKKNVFDLDNGYSFLWISILYLLGGYIKKYEIAKKLPAKAWILLASFFIFLTWSIKFFHESHIYNTTNEYLSQNMFVNYLSPTMLIVAIAFLCFFSEISFNNVLIKFITHLSPSTFGVYLLHVHPLVFNQIIKNRYIWITHLSPAKMVIAILSVAMYVFILCVGIETLRNIIL